MAWALEAIGVVMHYTPVARLLAEDCGGADVDPERLTGLDHAAGALHAHQITHLSAFNEATIVCHQGAIEAHPRLPGELPKHRLASCAEIAGGAEVADVVTLRPDLRIGGAIACKHLVARGVEQVGSLGEGVGHGEVQRLGGQLSGGQQQAWAL